MRQNLYRITIAGIVGFMAFCIYLMVTCLRIAGFTSPVQVAECAISGGHDIFKGFVYSFDEEELVKELPASVQGFIEENDWQFVRVDQEIMNQSAALKQQNLADIMGLTVTADHVVYLSKNDVDAYYAFYHEVGHVLDCESGWPSTSQEFLEIFQKEAPLYADANYHQTYGYAKTSEYEYFASVFCDYMLDNKKNLESVPNTVEYIRKLVAD